MDYFNLFEKAQTDGLEKFEFYLNFVFFRVIFKNNFAHAKVCLQVSLLSIR